MLRGFCTAVSTSHDNTAVIVYSEQWRGHNCSQGSCFHATCWQCPLHRDYLLRHCYITTTRIVALCTFSGRPYNVNNMQRRCIFVYLKSNPSPLDKVNIVRQVPFCLSVCTNDSLCIVSAHVRCWEWMWTFTLNLKVCGNSDRICWSISSLWYYPLGHFVHFLLLLKNAPW